MKIDFNIEGVEVLQKQLQALPIGLQHAVYGAGFKRAAAKVRRVARQRVPVGRGVPITRKGRIRKRLRDSIKPKLVGWRWDGRKVPKSAAIVVAEQPHAHLVESGTVKMPARPYLMPALRSGLSQEFRNGCVRHFARVVKQIDERKLTRATAKALKLKEV